MKLSVIIPVLNSHEIVRRQILYFEKMNLPDDVEILLMDDGSDPSLITDSSVASIHATNDFRPWTQEVARNTGARLAKGHNVLMLDVDHVVSKEAIDKAREFKGDKMNFTRCLAILDEDGNIDISSEALKSYGVVRKWRFRKRVRGHRNMFCMNRELFLKLGGYDESSLGEKYPYGGGADSKWITKWRVMERRGRVKTHDYTPEIYLIPNGKFCGDLDANPFELFHGLSRKSGYRLKRTKRIRSSNPFEPL